MTNNVLRYGIGAVTLMFAVFGGYLAGIAPPREADPVFAVGLASFLALIVLLFIMTLSAGKSQKARRDFWLRIASRLFCVAVVLAFTYYLSIHYFTFEYPPHGPSTRYVGGTQFTAEGQEAYYRLKDKSEVVYEFGLNNRDFVWTHGSIILAKILLTANYVGLAVCLAATAFALSEGALGGPGKDITISAR